MLIRFAHLQFNDKYNQQIFKLVCENSLENEKLFSLSKEYILTQGEIQKLRQYYATELDLPIKNIKVK